MKKNRHILIPGIRHVCYIPAFFLLTLSFLFAGNWKTPFDGNIIVPERVSFTLYIFNGGTSKADIDWNDENNILWSMPLRDAEGVSGSDMAEYNNLWRSENSLNDVKRVIHNNRIHLAVTGNGGDGVALYDFETKECIYWSKTTEGHPHDVDYIPLGTGFLVVASPNGANDSFLELYDISENNQGRIPGTQVKHAGVHSVHWDAEEQKVWAWGGGNDQLKLYDIIMDNGVPGLEEVAHFKEDVSNYDPGTGHGGAPMFIDGQWHLLLAGRDGILSFNLKTHQWDLVQKATSNWYTNPKGLSYNPETGEIITTRSQDAVYSVDPDVDPREIKNSQIYKARWWFHNEFSYPIDTTVASIRTSLTQRGLRIDNNITGQYREIRFFNTGVSRVLLSILDGKGSLLKNLYGQTAPPGERLFTLDTGPFVAGAYYVRAFSANDYQVKPLFIIK